jgi:hypothetical protein
MVGGACGLACRSVPRSYGIGIDGKGRHTYSCVWYSAGGYSSPSLQGGIILGAESLRSLIVTWEKALVGANLRLAAAEEEGYTMVSHQVELEVELITAFLQDLKSLGEST